MPAPGVDGEHDPGRQAPVLCGADDVGGGVEDEALANPVGLPGPPNPVYGTVFPSPWL
jgi:hypothetical protein